MSYRGIVGIAVITGLAACGGGGDGTGPGGGGGGLTAQQRAQIVSTLSAVGTSIAGTGDTTVSPLMAGLAGVVQGGASFTTVNVTTNLGAGRIGGQSSAAGTYLAMALEPALVYPNGTVTPDLGAYDGSLVIQPTGEIIIGLGLYAGTNQTFPPFIGLLIKSQTEIWYATAMSAGGVSDTILGGNCLGSAPSYVTECVRVSMFGSGFNITQSAPLPFQGNTATGSRTATLPYGRLRGVRVTVDCTATTAC